MPSWIVRFILPFVIDAVLKSLVSVLTTMAKRSDSKVDDNLVEVVDNEQNNIKSLILTEIAKRT